MSEQNKDNKDQDKPEPPPINTKKWLYAFSLPRTYEKKVEETRQEDGQEIKVTKNKVITEDVEIFLKRPTRKMYDECNLFYSVQISRGVKAGLLTRAMIAKRYKNDGGGLSQEEQDDFAEKYNQLLLKEKEFQVVQLNLQEEKDLTLIERQEKLAEIVTESEILKAELEKYEVAAESLYEHTAEARAARMTNMWWLFNLTFTKFINNERGGIEDYNAVFFGKDFDRKSQSYEEIELEIQESDDRFNNFEASLIEKASYLLAAWNGGNAKVYEDFKRVDESLEFIKDEVRKDEALQDVYEDKIKSLAGLDMEMPTPTYSPEEEKEAPKEAPKEASEKKTPEKKTTPEKTTPEKKTPSKKEPEVNKVKEEQKPEAS
jgi:hypothetical protein